MNDVTEELRTLLDDKWLRAVRDEPKVRVVQGMIVAKLEPWLRARLAEKADPPDGDRDRLPRGV